MDDFATVQLEVLMGWFEDLIDKAKNGGPRMCQKCGTRQAFGDTKFCRHCLSPKSKKKKRYGNY